MDADGRVVNGQRPSSSRTLRSISPIRAAGGATNPEVVDAIIARLSLETGPHFQTNGNGSSSNDDNYSEGLGQGAWTDSGEEDGLLKVGGCPAWKCPSCPCVDSYPGTPTPPPTFSRWVVGAEGYVPPGSPI